MSTEKNTSAHFLALITDGFSMFLLIHTMWTQELKLSKSRVQKRLKILESIRKSNLISNYVPSCFLYLLCVTYLCNFETWNCCWTFCVLSSEKKYRVMMVCVGVMERTRIVHCSLHRWAGGRNSALNCPLVEFRGKLLSHWDLSWSTNSI